MKHSFKLLPGTVQVSLDHGQAPADIVPVLLDAARLARERDLQSLLVVSGVNDPASAEAVSLALDEIHALGAPPPSRIAFVAYMLQQYSAYHFAEWYAPRLGIAAKVHVCVRDAKDWLGVRENLRAAALRR